MRVRMRVDISGDRGGDPWPAAGQVLDVGPTEAHELARAGIADVVPDDATPESHPDVDPDTGRSVAEPEPEPEAEVETATEGNGETAATTTGSRARKAARGGRTASD